MLLDNPLGGSAGLPCQAGLRPHSRLFIQFVRRLTTKELVFLRVVALQNARVNDKKNAATPYFVPARKWSRKVANAFLRSRFNSDPFVSCASDRSRKMTSGFTLSSVAISVETEETPRNARETRLVPRAALR